MSFLRLQAERAELEKGPGPQKDRADEFLIRRKAVQQMFDNAKKLLGSAARFMPRSL